MKRLKALEPLQKQVGQVDSAEGEKRRLAELKETWSSDRERLVASGRFDDERAVTAASTFQTKLSMYPYKVRQLDALIANVVDGMGPALRAARNELSGEHDLLIVTARRDLVMAIEPALDRILGHDLDAAEAFAVQVANTSLVVRTLLAIEILASQNVAHPVDQARELLGAGSILARIREAFFSGDKLNLEAVEKKTAFKVAP